MRTPFWSFYSLMYLAVWFGEKQVKCFQNMVYLAASLMPLKIQHWVLWGGMLAKGRDELFIVIIECPIECAILLAGLCSREGFSCNSVNICGKQSPSKKNPPR